MTDLGDMLAKALLTEMIIIGVVVIAVAAGITSLICWLF